MRVVGLAQFVVLGAAVLAGTVVWSNSASQRAATLAARLAQSPSDPRVRISIREQSAKLAPAFLRLSTQKASPLDDLCERLSDRAPWPFRWRSVEARRIAAISALTYVEGHDGAVVQNLVALLDDPSSRIGLEAEIALVKRGTSVIEHLVRLFPETGERGKVGILSILAKLQQKDDESVKVFEQALRDPKSGVRMMAAYESSGIPKEAGIAIVPALRNRLSPGEQPWTRVYAAWSIYRLTGSADEFIKTVEDCWNGEDKVLQSFVERRLRELRDAAVEAEPKGVVKGSSPNGP
jgi:hypothetical protein